MAWARIFLFLGATLCRIFFFCGVKNHLKEDRRSYIRIIILSRVYNKPTQRPVLNWLVSLIGRALHRYRRGQGFESRISLTIFFFLGFLSATAKVAYVTAMMFLQIELDPLHRGFSFDFPLFSDIVGATHAYYSWSPKSYGLYPSPRCTTGPKIVGSCCTPLPTRTPQLSQHC